MQPLAPTDTGFCPLRPARPAGWARRAQRSASVRDAEPSLVKRRSLPVQTRLPQASAPSAARSLLLQYEHSPLVALVPHNRSRRERLVAVPRLETRHPDASESAGDQPRESGDGETRTRPRIASIGLTRAASLWTGLRSQLAFRSHVRPLSCCPSLLPQTSGSRAASEPCDGR